MYQADENVMKPCSITDAATADCCFRSCLSDCGTILGTHCDYKKYESTVFYALTMESHILTLQTITDRNREVQNAISEEF